jgi:hypothetical protein
MSATTGATNHSFRSRYHMDLKADLARTRREMRSFARKQSAQASCRSLAYHSERSAVSILLKQNTDVRVIQVLLGHSKLDTASSIPAAATFSLETRAREVGGLRGPQKLAQKHDPFNVRWIKDLSCRSEQGKLEGARWPTFSRNFSVALALDRRRYPQQLQSTVSLPHSIDLR